MAELAPLRCVRHSTFRIPHSTFRPPSTFRTRDFSFTEIMFAVIILGIGFIMVAAIFPVAIQQAKSNSEETSAAALARGAANYLDQIFNDGPRRTGAQDTSSNAFPSGVLGNFAKQATPTVPALVQQPSHFVPGPPTTTGLVYPPPLWTAAAGSVVFSEDPRFGYVFLYRRQGQTDQPNTWSASAQVYIFPVQARTTTIFEATSPDPTKLPRDTTVPRSYDVTTQRWSANLQAREVQVVVVNDVAALNGVDLIAFDRRNSVPVFKRVNIDAAAEGAYVVIAYDKINPAAAAANPNAGRVHGLVFRLGARHPEFDNADLGVAPFNNPNPDKVVYELQPGNDFKPDPGANGILALSGPNAGDDIEAVGNTAAIAGTNSTVAFPDTADAFLVGRGYSVDSLNQIADPANPNPLIAYEGPAMPIGVYTTFVKVN
jgi:hypothetical protein